MNIHDLVNYPELEKIIDKAKIKSYYQFEYQKMIFTVFTHNHTKEDELAGNLPFFYKSHSSMGDYDIYIAKNISKKEFRKSILLHETLEPFLREVLNFDESDENSLKIPHNIASEYDEKYAKSKMDNNLFSEYLKFKKDLTK